MLVVYTDMEKITTSLKVSKSTYKLFKKKCIDLGIEYSEGLDQALLKWLKSKMENR